MSIATRRGDDGTTGLLYGQRVPKDHPQIEALGAGDELNVALGAAKLLAPTAADRELIGAVQGALVALMGEIASAQSDAARHATSEFAKLGEADLARLDRAVEALESRGLRFDGWAAPGANARAVALDQARVAARRAERRLIAMERGGRRPRPLVLQFINRLSDVLWLMAREAEN